MMLEMMKELFSVTHVRDDEEEVPNAKHMRIVEEEVSLSQPVTVAVSPKEEVPLEEEEFLAPIVVVLQAPLSQSHRRKRRSHQPPLSWSRQKEGDALSLYHPW
jgi:hypothetical protein